MIGKDGSTRELIELARARLQAGDLVQAVAAARQAVAWAPDDPAACGFLGALLIELARREHAEAASRRAVASQGTDRVLREAVGLLRKAQRATPDAPAPWRNCAIALRELGDLQAAHEALRVAHRLRPEDPDIACDLAFSLQCLGQTEAAVALYESALTRVPDHANAHAGLALSLLGRGDFARGWKEYEWRLRVGGSGIRREFPFPLWQGEDLAGRCLFVYSEQGIGDEIMFASCFDELRSLAGHCVFESSKRLVPLFERSFPQATIVSRDRSRMPDWSKLPAIDLHIAAGSVPRFLRDAPGRFPERRKYLVADPARVRYWRERLERAGPGRKIGVAWTGGLPGTLRAARSLSLEDLRPLLETFGATFVGLEFLDCNAEVDAYNRGRDASLHWWPEAVKTLDETAALVSALDLVISVTTATAHLAGALGRPTWVLVPSVPTWRYMWQGERMPWYPSVRVLRGQGAAPREAVVRTVRQALEAFCRAT